MDEIKVRDMIAMLSYEQLKKLQRDLASGGGHLKILVDQKIEDIETSDRGVCAFCGTPLRSHDHPYTLLFGPKDFRKKASFCGLDCMDSFSKNLRIFQKN